MSNYILPRYDKRTVVVGSTGSGKTYLACWILSQRDLNHRPWIIIDFKGDQLLEDIGAKEISIFDNPPTRPGLYIVRPIAEVHDDALSQFMWKIWHNENTGVYVDEGSMLGRNNSAVNALYTQGRSKNIEMITLTQRPVWCHRSLLSEANHFYVMRLTNTNDRKYIGEFLGGIEFSRLPRYHAQWYNADEQEGAFLAPVPDRKTILNTFQNKLQKERKVSVI